MPGIIVNANNINIASLQANGAYINIENPPGYVIGQPTDVLAMEGTASWGPINQPILLGDDNDLIANYGGITADSPADPYDLPRAAIQAFQQAQSGASLQVLANRIGDGTETEASVEILDTTAVTPLHIAELQAKYPGKGGNNIKALVAPGAKTDTFNVTITAPFGGTSEIFYNIQGGSAGVFAANLVDAINNGQLGVRPPSQFVTAINPNVNSLDPALGPYQLAGGTDGRSGVNDTHILGTDDPSTPTGIYVFRNQSPSLVGGLVLPGFTDETSFPTVQAMCNQEGIVYFASLPAGTTDAQAISTKKSIGFDDYNGVLCMDWVKWKDPVNGKQQLSDPAVFIAARTMCLSPQLSPANKQVYGIIGTERTIKRTLAGIGALQAAGIMWIQNPINRGNMYGMWHGQNSSSNPATSDINYSRMTNFVARSLAAFLGTYIGEPQTVRPDDPTRANLKADVDNFLTRLKNAQPAIIDGFNPTICDLSNNSPDTIGQGYLFMGVQVRYVDVVKFIVVDYQGGENINISVQDVQQAA